MISIDTFGEGRIESPNSTPGSLPDLLDEAHRRLMQLRCFEAFELLGKHLSVLHDGLTQRGQLAAARATAREHPIFELCQQDPYTHRAFTKPRGYAGDAPMLDYVYEGQPPASTTTLGQGIFRCTTRGPMGLSVMFRRSLLSAYINDAVARNRGSRILSVASGHCREVAETSVMDSDFTGEVVALDQDPESCAEVVRAYSGRIRTVNESIRSLTLGRLAGLGRFQLIYSAGLYDYLPDSMASRLSESLKAMLAPQGRLLLGNFSRGSHGRGYLDLLMDWRLIYRSSDELRRLAGESSAFDMRSFADPHGNVLYAELTRL